MNNGDGLNRASKSKWAVPIEYLIENPKHLQNIDWDDTLCAFRSDLMTMISKNTDTKSKNGYIKEFFKLHKHLTDSGDSIPIVEYKVNYNKHGKAIQEPCMISKHKLYEHVINHPE